MSKLIKFLVFLLLPGTPVSGIAQQQKAPGIAFLGAAQTVSPTFKILISSDPATVRTGTEIKVRVVLTNTSNHRINGARTRARPQSFRITES